MATYSGMELDELELKAFETGRRVGLEEAAKCILTWFTDPNHRAMAKGIRAIAYAAARKAETPKGGNDDA